jgi:subtilisin family serine protease
MRCTVLRYSAPIISSIALAFGLLAATPEPVKAQGLTIGGGFGGGGFSRGGGRRDNDRGPGGGGFGGGFSGPKTFERERDRPKEGFGGRRQGGGGMSGDAFKGRVPKELGERAPKSRFPEGPASRLGGGEDRRGGRLGKIDGGLDKNGRLPKNVEIPKGRTPYPKGDTASTGNPKFPGGRIPGQGRDPKGGDQAATGNAAGGVRDPRIPGKHPWPNRNPKGTDQASTDPTGTGKPPCRGPRCGGTQTGGGDDVPPSNPPCRGPKCGGTQTGGGGDDVPPSNSPCRGPRCGGTQTGGGGDVPPSNPPCRGPRCGGTQTGDNDGKPPYDPPCRGRKCRPPVIVIGPIGPMIPPADDFDDEEPAYEPPGYEPPYNPTPVYEPATPDRPRQPERAVDRTPPSPPPAPPSLALPAGPAPMPLRRALAVADQPPYRPNEVLVTVQGAQPDAVAGQLAQSFNLVIEESQGFSLLTDRRVYRFRIPDNRGVEEVVATVAAAPGVTQSLPNFYHVLQGGAGDLGGLQYALPKLRVPATQDLVSGRGVTVAVIDSGVDLGHPALKRASIKAYDAVDGGVKDPDRHGTAIAGIIAGQGEVNGIAPGVKVLAIRAFAPERIGGAPVTTSMTLARATDTAAAQGARVVNMSFAGPRDELLLSLIDAAHAKGIVFVAAAGNQGPDAPPAWPAAYEKVIGITATDEQDGLYAMANRGDYISVAAPGVDILVPVVGKALDYMSGTSFAAAHISGIAALLMERNPRLGPEDVRALLLEAAHDLGETGRDDDFGAGLADAFGAVSMAASTKVQSSAVNP